MSGNPPAVFWDTDLVGQQYPYRMVNDLNLKFHNKLSICSLIAFQSPLKLQWNPTEPKCLLGSTQFRGCRVILPKKATVTHPPSAGVSALSLSHKKRKNPAEMRFYLVVSAQSPGKALRKSGDGATGFSAEFAGAVSGAENAGQAPPNCWYQNRCIGKRVSGPFEAPFPCFWQTRK